MNTRRRLGARQLGAETQGLLADDLAAHRAQQVPPQLFAAAGAGLIPSSS
jgi:hypothetical protein